MLLFTVAILATLVCYMYAAAPRGNEAEMQKVIAQAMESAEVQDALKQALIQGSIQDEDDSPADLASLQSMLANMEQDNEHDENTVNEVCGRHANFWYTTAHSQWKNGGRNTELVQTLELCEESVWLGWSLNSH